MQDTNLLEENPACFWRESSLSGAAESALSWKFRDQMINDVDVVFHDILLQKAMRQDGDSYTGYKLRDSSAHAQLVGLYATQAESVRSDLERQSRASEEVVAISTGHELRGGSALTEVNKQKPVNPLLIPRLNGEY